MIASGWRQRMQIMDVKCEAPPSRSGDIFSNFSHSALISHPAEVLLGLDNKGSI